MRLRWLMSRVTGYAGVINSQGAKYLTSPADVKWILGETSRRGLVSSSTTGSRSSRSRARSRLKKARALRAATCTIDRNPIREAIEREFAALEDLAKQRGMRDRRCGRVSGDDRPRVGVGRRLGAKGDRAGAGLGADRRAADGGAGAFGVSAPADRSAGASVSRRRCPIGARGGDGVQRPRPCVRGAADYR